MNKLSTVLRYIWALFLLMPLLGALGVFPPPTADMYSPRGWAFMSAMMDVGYLMPLIGVLCVVCAVLLIMNKTALVAILMAPFVTNIFFFHIIDNSLFKPASLFAWIFIIFNIYFLWVNREKYKTLW